MYQIYELEYYPYDKYKSPHTETPTSKKGGGVLWSELWSTQIWSFHFWGVLWSELWSTQIWSLHWGGGSTLIWTLVNSNLKSSFGGGGTLIWTLVNSNLKSSFGEGTLIWTLVNSNLKSSWGRGGTLIWNSREGCSGEFGQKIYCSPETCLCITDSLSYTTYVETNYGSTVFLICFFQMSKDWHVVSDENSILIQYFNFPLHTRLLLWRTLRVSEN